MVKPYQIKAAYEPSSSDKQNLKQAEQNGWQRHITALRGRFRIKFQKLIAYKAFAIKQLLRAVYQSTF